MKKIKISLILLLLSCAVLQAQPWQYLGPINRTGATSGQGSGMVNSIAFHPKYNTADPSIGGEINKTIFIGSSFGGLWISRNDGATWNTSDPKNQYTNLSTDGFLYGCGVSKILVDPVTPTTLYAVLTAPVSILYGLHSGNMHNYYPVTGVYKYTPGTGWVLKRSYPYLANKCITELKFDPANHSTLFACMDDGVYKYDDVSGSWTGSLVSEGAGEPFRNLVFDPTNSANIYASGREVYKSTNGGSSFTQISNFVSLLPDLIGTIVSTNIAVLSSTAIYARVHYYNGGRTEKIFRYNGSIWTALSTPIFPSLWEYHYDRMPLQVRKVGTTEYLFAGSEVLNLWNSSTATWTSEGYNDKMHADLHDIAFSPDGSVLMIAHDGGVSKLASTSNFYSIPNANWVTCNTNLNIATVISFSGSQKNPNIILTGEHDNGSSIIKNATTGTTWTGYSGGDGGDKMTSLFDANEWYDREIQGGGSSIKRVDNGIETSSGTTIFTNGSISPSTSIYEHTPFEEFGDKKPMVMDPNNPNIIYRGSNILVRSLDKGATSQILFRKSDCYEKTNYDPHSHTNCIVIAPTNSSYLYMNFINPYSFEPSFTNHIYRTTNALTSTYAVPCNHTTANEGVNCGIWTEITPNFGFSNKKSVINAIVVSDKDPNVIWAGFNWNTDIAAANRKDYLVWKYDGTNWTNWSQGLPNDVSVTALVYEKGSNDGIYAGTDVAGVFYRSNTTGGWIPYGSGMPHVLIHQMEINYTENTLRIGTYGRGIWKNTLYCPSSPLSMTCYECNASTPFWEGTTVTIQNTTLTTYKQYVRARDYIDILPNSTFTANATALYDFYIHGCSPGQYNSYRGPKEVTSDDDLVIDFGEDTDEEEEAPLSVFPNPNNGVFTLNTGTSEEKDIYVYDILGKIVYQKNKTSEKTLSIDITNAPKGIFLVKVIQDDKTETVKIINQ